MSTHIPGLRGEMRASLDERRTSFDLLDRARAAHTIRSAQRVYAGTMLLTIMIALCSVTMAGAVAYGVYRVLTEGLSFTVTVDGVEHTYGVK